MRLLSAALITALVLTVACRREESAVSSEAEAARNGKADAAFASAAAVPAAQPASTEPEAPSRTIIEVNGETINELDFAAAMEALPDRMKQTVQTAAGRRALAEELVRLKLLEQEGRRLGVDQEADVARAIDMSTANIIASAALRKLSERVPEDEELRKLYEQSKSKYEVVRARQITVAYEGGAIPALRGSTLDEKNARARAAKAAERLRKGESFEAVAGEMSDDPMLAQSGGLMMLRRGEVPVEVEKQVFGAAEGGVTDPIRSDIGYHVFVVVKKEIPSFDEVKGSLSREARSSQLDKLVEQLKGNAKVKLDERYLDDPGSGAAPAASATGS